MFEQFSDLWHTPSPGLYSDPKQQGVWSWDPSDHSEGHFSLKVKKFEKSLDMGSRGLPSPGRKKVRKELNTS